MPDSNISYTSVVTPIGLAKLGNAALLKIPLELTQIKLGDANGAPYEPDGSETDLKNVVYTGSVNTAEKTKASEVWVEVEAIVPQNEGPFWVREMGIYDKDGDLIFICAVPSRYKPDSLQEFGSSVDMSFIMTVDIVNADSVQFIIDPHTAVATRAWVDNRFGLREIKGDADIETNDSKLHYVLAKSAMKIPDNEGTLFFVEVDKSVDVSTREVTLVNASGAQLEVDGKLVDRAVFLETGRVFKFKKVNGVWKA